MNTTDSSPIYPNPESDPSEDHSIETKDLHLDIMDNRSVDSGMTTLIIARHLLILTALATSTSACKGSDKAAPETRTEAASEGSSDKSEKAETPAKTRVFEKGFAKDSCALISKIEISKLFSLADSEVKKMSAAGLCIYSWTNKEDKKEMRVALHPPQILRDEKMAKRYFSNATKNRSSKEVAAQMEQVTKMAEKRGDLESKSKKTAAKKIGIAIADKGTSWKDVEGVGQAARMNTRDGKLFVWQSNLLFSLAAYLGPQAPKPDMKGVTLKNLATVAKKNEDEWTHKTLTEREKAASDVARKIISNFAK